MREWAVPIYPLFFFPSFSFLFVVFRPLGSRSKPLCPELRLLEDYNVDLTTSRIECQPNAWKSKQQHGYTL